MFHRQTESYRQSSISQEVTVILDKGCSLEGRLRFEGTARIEGEFIGDIQTPDILILGAEAKVQGKIEADVVVISGNFKGEIYATHRVEILTSAVVQGNIKAAVLHIEEGAVFEGQTEMLAPFPIRS